MEQLSSIIKTFQHTMELPKE